jgi:hypothetical protein
MVWRLRGREAGVRFGVRQPVAGTGRQQLNKGERKTRKEGVKGKEEFVWQMSRSERVR